jgi:hypothetical protein
MERAIYSRNERIGAGKGIRNEVRAVFRTRRFRGFTRTDKLCVGIVLLLIVLVISGLPSHSVKDRACNVRCSSEGDQIPTRAIERIAENRFVEWAGNPIVVEAIREANNKPAKSLDEIIQLDRRWIEEQAEQEWVNQFLDNPCARYLKQLQNGKGSEKRLYAEIFVMDRQGCIVAESKKTSDYWQGDEDKFVKAFADGRGAVFIDGSAYDESTQTSLIQVSVPVIDPETGEAIGVMTVGLNIGILSEKI